MIHIEHQNSSIDNTGLIFNWNISSNFDKNGECFINFELPYSMNCNPMIAVEPKDKCLVFDITHTSFKLKRKSKRVKEVKWFVIGY